MAMDSAKEEATHSQCDMGFQDNAQLLGYGLRENPKKSWKFSGLNPEPEPGFGPNTTSIQENKCRVCGKEFESPKALFGHMRHHSSKGRKRIHCEDCGKAFLSSKSLANHSRVHSEKFRVSNHDMGVERLCLKRKRSGRKRCKFAPSSRSKVSSFNDNTESLSVSETDREAVQGALCLLMLSRGGLSLDGFNPFSVDSENDSVTPEDESFSLKKRILENENGNECYEMKKQKWEKEGFSDSDSLSFLIGKKENKGIDPNSGSGCHCNEVKNVNFENGMVMLLGDANFNSSKAISSDVLTEKEVGLNDSSVEYRGTISCGKEATNGTSSSEILEDSRKKLEFNCDTCKRNFCSRKALGGHLRVHNMKKCSTEEKIENYEKQEHQSSIVSEEYVENSMEISKEFKCAICFKAFTSGQALGGHKRAHLLKNAETRTEQIEVKQERLSTFDRFDLNIPIMVDN